MVKRTLERAFRETRQAHNWNLQSLAYYKRALSRNPYLIWFSEKAQRDLLERGPKGPLNWPQQIVRHLKIV